MPHESHLVSIVMPVFNAERFLEEALDSVLEQTYSNWELIVVDDGSTDDSLKILRDYHQKDKRIRVFVNEMNQGVAETLNRGIRTAKGELIARMDADDVMKPNRLAKQVAYLSKNPECVAVGTWMKVIDSSSHVVGRRRLPTDHARIYSMMFYAMGLQHPTLMFNRRLVPQNFSWYERVRYAEDLDMMFRLVKFGKFANLPEYLHCYRINDANVSLTNIKATFQAAWQVRERAVKEYDYVPTFEAVVKRFMSRLVLVVPDFITMKAYNVWRS